jgi:2'-5' RNA ligase
MSETKQMKNVGYAVELFIKLDESESIQRLFKETNSILADIDTRPHISLAVFDEVDIPKLCIILHDFAARLEPLTLRFSSIGLFPGTENIVFLAPVVTELLISAHAMLHRYLADADMKCHSHYLPGTWVPHCTITAEEPLEKSIESIQKIHSAQVLGEYSFESVHLIKFRPVVSLASFQLGNEK